MGRPKKFNRDDVLGKAIPLFWAKGFADTGLQELEQATGVNKSGLYSEFKGKDDLFVESLRYYYANGKGRELLHRDPLGFANIEDYLRFISERQAKGNTGCFGVNCLRELGQLPVEAKILIEQNRAALQNAFLKNVQAEKTSFPSEQIADLISTFFSGVCIEENINSSQDLLSARIDSLMHAVRHM